MDRHPLYAVLVVGALLLAGCAGGVPSSPTGSTVTPAGATATANDVTTSSADSTATGATGGPPTAGTGTVDFYVSDEENAIGDFEHVNVTVTKVGFQRGGEAGAWVEYDVDDATVDLTELQGPRSAYVDSYDLPDGNYTTVFVYVGGIEATLEDGEAVRVKLPSEKLQLTTGFSLEDGSSVEFVFDVTVKRAGNSGKYILRPVVTESGTDVPVEPVEDDERDSDDAEDGHDGAAGGEGDGDAGDVSGEADDESGGSARYLEAAFEGDVSPGENATLLVTRNGSAVENATVAVDDELVGTTEADGELTVAIPESDAVTVVVEADGDEVELEFEFE